MNRGFAILFAVCAALAFGPTRAEDRFIARLDGEHAVPAVVTPAAGTVNFTLLGDTAIQYDVQVARLRDVWSVGVYSAGTGSDGFKAVTLYVGPKTGEFNGTLARGTFSDRDMLGGMAVRELTELMRKRQVYVEVRTAEHPGGELRGPVMPATQGEKEVAIEGKPPMI